ncbi:MAG TPA: PEP-CTERM sorting domain-containing protein [Fimbriimonadaceae bacterium]|nr:PEP-CTERM sorting domain-containing protein [Fimbriimonadaceae bacterium]HRI73254.1 PEP-CTERM sorting domain-containing protein [Fimbriimonadaceae bacterium]
MSLVAMGIVASSQATWTQWSGNGHYYDVIEITGNDYSWTAARDQAAALTGPGGSPVTLATITSAAENSFVFSLIDNPTYWAIDGAGNNEGPYLGGFQPAGAAEPAGGWEWITGEAWSYTSWTAGEPNNSGGNENILVYFGPGGSRTSNWNDGGNVSNSVIHYYVAETQAVPEPMSMVVLSAALAGVVARRRKAKLA